MDYVNPKDVMDKFVQYLSEYKGDLIDKGSAIMELQDALDSAEYEEIE